MGSMCSSRLSSVRWGKSFAFFLYFLLINKMKFYCVGACLFIRLHNWLVVKVDSSCISVGVLKPSSGFKELKAFSPEDSQEQTLYSWVLQWSVDLYRKSPTRLLP